MEKKNERNKNKIILGDFNCTMDKMDRYGGNKTQRLYRCCSNYVPIVNTGLRIYGERKTQNPLSFLGMTSLLSRTQDIQGLY